MFYLKICLKYDPKKIYNLYPNVFSHIAKAIYIINSDVKFVPILIFSMLSLAGSALLQLFCYFNGDHKRQISSILMRVCQKNTM